MFVLLSNNNKNKNLKKVDTFRKCYQEYEQVIYKYKLVNYYAVFTSKEDICFALAQSVAIVDYFLNTRLFFNKSYYTHTVVSNLATT